MIQPRIDKTPPSSSSSAKMSTTMTCFFFASFLAAAVSGNNLFYIFHLSLPSSLLSCFTAAGSEIRISRGAAKKNQFYFIPLPAKREGRWQI